MSMVSSDHHPRPANHEIAIEPAVDEKIIPWMKRWLCMSMAPSD